MKKLLVFAVCSTILFQANQVYSQGRPDSLWNTWVDTTKADTIRLLALYDYTWEYYMRTNPDSAYHLAQSGLDFAKSINNLNEAGFFLSLQANTFQIKGEYKRAIEVYNKCIDAFQLAGNMKSVASNIGNLGSLYLGLGDFELAISNLRESLGLAEQQGNMQLVAGNYNNISNIYSHQGKFSKSIEMLEKCLKIQEEIGDSVGVGGTLSNIGAVYHIINDLENALLFHERSLNIRKRIRDNHGYAISLFNIGSVHFAKQNFTNALLNYEQALVIQEKIVDLTGAGRTLNYIGKTHKELGDVNLAQQFCERALVVNERIENKLETGTSLQVIGEIYALKNMHSKQEQYLNKALDLFREAGFVNQTKDVSEKLYAFYKSEGDARKALEMHELYVQMRDSIANEENIKELARFAFKYEYEKKALADSLRTLAENEAIAYNHQVEVAQKETERNLYASAGLILLFASFLFYQRKANKNKLKLKENEAAYQQELIYASINSQENERRRIARDLHDEVGAMLSTLKLQLGAVSSKLKTAEEDNPVLPAVTLVNDTITNVRRISKDLLPPTLEKFGLAHALNELSDKVSEASGIAIQKELPEQTTRLEVDRELALYRVIQEMMNNAMKHAEATAFKLTLREENGQLHLYFSDNGKGFDIKALQKSRSGQTGLGLKNLENRVGAAGGKMELKSSQGHGTQLKVEVSILHSGEKAA